ncbi:ester cyclase [Nocardia sp. NPDC060256]|uniref:ester cyclase n=1 Tax=unclassified Nocardia TaxID=2637762 RepID=UPI00365622F9
MNAVHLTVEEVAIRCVHMMADGAIDEFAALIHSQAVNREAVAEPPACRGRGPQAFFASAQWLRSAYADMSWEVHEAVSDGGLVVLHTTMSGRQVGAFVAYDAEGKVAQAFPATGRQFAVTQTHWCRISDGQLIEHWANRDDLGQAMQLGWTPPSPAYLVRMLRATRRARRVAAGIAAAAVVVASVALSGCSASGNSTPATPSAAVTSTQQAPAAAPAPASAGEACAEVAFEVTTVRDLQHGNNPADIRAAARRIDAFALSAPGDIRRAAQGAAGPAITVMKHPEVRGEVSSPAVENDVQELDAWHASHC